MQLPPFCVFVASNVAFTHLCRHRVLVSLVADGAQVLLQSPPRRPRDICGALELAIHVHWALREDPCMPLVSRAGD